MNGSMSSNTWKTDNDFAPGSATMWVGDEEFSFQPIKSEAEEFSFQPIKTEFVQGGSEELSFQPIKTEIIQDGVNNCPFSFMPLQDSCFSSVPLQENAANYFGNNYADNSNRMASSTHAYNAHVNPGANSFLSISQANNTHLNPFANSFSPVGISSNVNLSQNYLGLEGQQSLDLNNPPINLPGRGYDLVAVKTEPDQSFALGNEPSGSFSELSHGYDNWMMYDAFQTYTSQESNDSFLSIGKADYVDPVPESSRSRYQESSIRAQLVQPTCQGLFTTSNNVACGDFGGYDDPVPYSCDSSFASHGEKSNAVTGDPALGFTMGPVLNLSDQQVSTQQFGSLANKHIFGDSMSEGLIEAGLKMYPAYYDQPGKKMSSNLLYHSSESRLLSNKIRLPGTSQKPYNPERSVSAAAVSGQGVSAADRTELARDPGNVGTCLLKRGSDQRPSSAMATQCKKRGVTEQQFVHPLFSSTHPLLGQNSFDKIFPTSASLFSTPGHLNASSNASTPGHLNASSNASTPTLMPQYVASGAQIPSLGSTFPPIFGQSKKGVIQQNYPNPPYSSTQSLLEQNSLENIFPTISCPFNTPNPLNASFNASTLPLMPAETHIPSPSSTSPAMSSQCKKGVTQNQFVHPTYSSTRSLLPQSSFEKMYPTTASPNILSSRLYASSRSNSRSLIPQHVASDTQVSTLRSSSPALSPLANYSSTTGYANACQLQSHPLVPHLGNAHPTSMNFSSPSSSLISNIICRTPTVGPIASHVPNSNLVKVEGKSVTDLAQRSSTPTGSLKISTSSAVSGRKPAKIATPRKKTAGKLKATSPVPIQSIPAPKKLAISAPVPIQSIPAPKKPAISARALAQLQRLSSVCTSVPSSSPHIKWEGLDKPGVSGLNCRICKRDLAFSPEGPVSVPAILPEVAVLACGHTFHDQCLLAITPQDQSSNPPCIPCALGD